MLKTLLCLFASLLIGTPLTHAAGKTGIYLGVNRAHYDIDGTTPRGAGPTLGITQSYFQDAFAGFRFHLQQNYLTTSKSKGYSIRGPSTLVGLTLNANFNVKDLRNTIGLGAGANYIGQVECKMGPACPIIPDVATGFIVDIMTITKDGWFGIGGFFVPTDAVRSRMLMSIGWLGGGYQFGGGGRGRSR